LLCGWGESAAWEHQKLAVGKRFTLLL
jgi:hypothetical protein